MEWKSAKNRLNAGRTKDSQIEKCLRNLDDFDLANCQLIFAK